MRFGRSTRFSDGRVRLAAKGALAGLAGTAVMTAAQTRLLPLIPSGEARRSPRHPAEAESQAEAATETAARRIVEGLMRRRLPEGRKKLAGNLIHYGTGAGWGAIYALSTPRRPRVADGLAFGTLVWLLGDNLIAPSLRLSDWAWRYPLGSNLKGFLAHLIYGVGSALALRTERA